MFFSINHVWMCELDYKESWALKKGFSWTVVLEKTPESPLDCREIQPVHPKGDQFWIFTGRTDAEAETPILGPPDAKNGITGKDLDVGKDWSQEKRGRQRMRVVVWHHWLDRHEFEQAPGVGDGPGSVGCCSPRGRNESDTTEWLNWTECISLEPQGLRVWPCFKNHLTPSFPTFTSFQSSSHFSLQC